MNKTFLIILLISISSISFSQNKASIEWGSIQKSSKYNGHHIVEGDEDVFFIFKRNPSTGKIWIEKYSTKLDLIYSEELKIKKGDIKKILYIENKLVCFSYYKDKKAKKTYLYKNTIDVNGKVEGEAILVDEFSYQDEKRSVYCDIRLTPDKNKYLVCQYFGLKGYRGNIIYNAKVFDKNFSLLSSSKIELPYCLQDTYLKRLIINNEGNIIIKVTTGYLQHKKGGLLKDLVYYFQPETDKLSEYQIELPDKVSNNLCSKFIMEDGKNIVAGFYSNNNGNKISGVYHMIIDFKKGTQKITTNPLTEYSSFPLGVNLEDIRINQLYLSNDHLYLLSEKTYTTLYTFYDSYNMLQSGLNYHFGDISIIKMKINGDIVWSKNIKKNTKTESDSDISIIIKEKKNEIFTNRREFLSYSAVFDKDREDLRFVLNLPPKYLNLDKEVKKSKHFWKPLLLLIDKHGNISQNYLVSDEELSNKKLDRFELLPKWRYKVSENMSIVLGQHENQFKFGILKD